MQAEAVFSGIGGQGVQLIAKTLAQAATMDGARAMFSARYGGEVRGGQSEASVVIGDEKIRTLPILPSTWSAVLMHSDWWEPVRGRLNIGGVVVLNSTLVTQDLGLVDATIFPIPATEVAFATTGVMTAGFVLLGAYIAITDMVRLDSAVDAMRSLVPPYREQHIVANESALRTGFGLGPPRSALAPIHRPFRVVSG